MSRGTIYTLGAGVRKGFALFWTALLLAALLLQYVAVLSPAKTLAANDTGSKVMGGFEVDGDFPAAGSADWANSTNSGAGLVSGPTVQDPMNADPSVLSNGVSDGDSVADWQMNGSAQPGQKADVGNVYAVNRVSGGDQWAYIGIERQSGQGTVQYDLEFNKLGNRTNSHGVSVPNRSSGDQLFTATQTGGGGWTINGTVQHWTGAWNTGSWSAPQPIAASLFYGLANQYAAQHPTGWADALGSTVPVNQFAEMAMNVSEIASGFIGCPGFGTLNIRSISSTGNTPELKDVVAPLPLDLSTCGSLSWQKQDGAGHALGGASFTITPDPWTGTGSATIADLTSGSPASGHGDQDNRAGFFKLADVIPDTYTVQEKSAPAGYLLDPAVKTVTVATYQAASISYIWEDPAQVPPTIATTSSASAADFGTKVHDDATLTGTFGPASGTVDFYLCGPSASNPNCATGGTKIGSDTVTTTANGGTVTSPDYTVGLTAAASGHYCWRAEYTPDANSLYLAGSHTNATTECFYVAPATISITKTANPVGPVSAGDEVGFDITVTNNGTQTTLGVHMTDVLPVGITWTADAATGSTATCQLVAGTLTCDAAALAAGKSFAVHVHGLSAPAVCGTMTNTANVGTSNDGSDTATASVVVNCPGLIITKTADAATVNAGDAIGFTVSVSNAGAGIARSVTLHDPLPAGVTWTVSPAVAGCSIAAGVLDCSFGDMAPAGSASVHVTAATSFEACTKYDNTATASATNAPSVQASASITCQKPALTITKTADAATVNAGDAIGFTVTVGNSGPGTAKSVTLHDPLPAGVTWTVSPAVTGCSITSGVLDCTAIGNLAKGDTFSVHVSAATSYAACATYNNTATASATNAPSVQASASITCQKPALTIHKTADAATVSAGDAIGFTIVVGNSGPGIARSVTLHDPLPAGVTWTTGDAACSIASGVLDCSFGDMVSGASASVHVSARTTAAACTKYDNTATASATNAPSVNDSASITCLTPDVTVVKTADTGTISAGDTAGFTMLVSNIGAGKAYNVTLSDPLPANVAWSTANSACSINANVLTCSWASLDAAASVSVKVSGETTAAACGTLNNTATVAATNEPSANLGNNQSSASITVVCPPVSITKTADAKSVSAGDQLGFTITVSNNSDFTALNVTVDDPLPVNAGLGWSIDGAANGFSIAGGHLTHAATTMAAHTSLTVHIVSSTTAATCGIVDNTASLTFNGGTGEDSSSVRVDCPDVTITKTAAKSPILAGQTASYTITVTNLGPGTAYGVTVNDPLPAGVDWVADNEMCSITEGVLVCTVGTLAEGATFSVTLTGPTTSEQCGQIPNTATVAATNEPQANTENNQASASITVQCAAISLVKTAGNAADGTTLVLQDPANVLFTYVVTNTGTADLENLVLVDDNATPANKADDVTVTCPKDSLKAGESMTCHAIMAVGRGLRTNIAVVTGNPALDVEGTVSATDDATVQVPEAEITPTPTPSRTPKITLPPTSTLDGGPTGSPSGSGLLMVLVAVGVVMLAVGLVAPRPATARRRSRRS